MVNREEKKMRLDEMIVKRDLKAIYRDGNKLIKLFNEGYSKSDILNEALNQARVEETGLNIPRVLEVTKLEINRRKNVITTYE